MNGCVQHSAAAVHDTAYSSQSMMRKHKSKYEAAVTPVAITTKAVQEVLLLVRAEQGYPTVIPDAPSAQLQNLLGRSLGEKARTHHSLNAAGHSITISCKR